MWSSGIFLFGVYTNVPQICKDLHDLPVKIAYISNYIIYQLYIYTKSNKLKIDNI